jgi:SOS-response transcriptional repressor LexA
MNTGKLKRSYMDSQKTGRNMDVVKTNRGKHENFPNKALADLCAALIVNQMQIMGISQEKLAELMDMTRGNIGHYLNARRVPPLDKFLRLINIFSLEEKPVSEIFTIDQAQGHQISFPEYPAIKCPVISWEDATEWPFNKSALINSSSIDRLSHQIDLDANSYALKIEDDSMTSKLEEYSFRKGAFIVISPDKNYKDDDFVVAKKKDSNKLIFRQYKKSGGLEYLELLKEKHPDPMLRLTIDIKICGVVIAYLDTFKKDN